MITVFLVLVVIALALTAGAAAGRVPIWAPVFVLCVIEALRALPLR